MMTTTTAAVLSDDFKQRATAKLEAASAGRFFASANARLLPSFDRGADGGDGDELDLGVMLGKGAYCDVNEISAIELKRRSDGDANGNADERETFLPAPKRLTAYASTAKNGQTDESDFPVNLFDSKDELREYMSKNFLRHDDAEGEDHARYALKQLRPTNNQKQLETGLMDISIEARFLACLNHPNVIKMRGIAGIPLTPNFGVVLDRLYSTLEDRMDEWTEQLKFATSGGVCGCFGKVDPVIKRAIVFSAVTVAYDLSSALRYIHSNNLVYRDLKPENAGFDVRGDIKLFDFGFAKELTRKLHDAKSGLYKLTRMTGSPPYMAPENFLGKPYGKSADVFSYGVLLWEMTHGKFAFYHYDKHDYKDVVCDRKYRPSIDNSLSPRMQELIKESWDPEPKKRPTFDRIALLLRAEYQDLETDSSHRDEISRSEKMMMASMRSFRMHRERRGSRSPAAKALVKVSEQNGDTST